MAFVRKEVQELLNQYRQRIEKEFNVQKAVADFPSAKVQSQDYMKFKKEYMPSHVSWYEYLCNISERILKLSPGKSSAKLAHDIEIAHLNITPTGATSFSILAPLVFILITATIGFGLTFVFLPIPSMFPIVFSMLAGIALLFALRNIPNYMAIRWRLKGSNQMVLSIFYVVTFMRHTSNLEGAMRFASDHLVPPLSLDFKRILWNVETERYSTIRESLDKYLEGWREWNPEFIESFHLIESSLFESTEGRRLNHLDKSLTVILEGTYEKMLHFTHNLASPINVLNMLGIILPILGLVVLPLVVSFLTDENTAPLTLVMFIAALYNIAIPFCVYYLGKIILSKRPTGYGDTDVTVGNSKLAKYKNVIFSIGSSEFSIQPIIFSAFLLVVFMGIALFPLLLNAIAFEDFGIGGADLTTSCGQKFCFLDYHDSSAKKGPLVGETFGPYGLGAALLSLFFTAGLGLSIGLYYKLRSKNVYHIREKNKKLEKEFASALFQLGNRLGDGLPAEMAFGRVAESMRGTISGDFFRLVHQNITRLGMSVQTAIFDPKHGALQYFPSSIIKSSMKVLVQSVTKGPKVAAQALVNVAQYIKEIHKVNERLKDLLADSISSMQTQIKFLAPAIAGIVVGITSMVTTILSRLTELLAQSGSGADTGLDGIANILGDGMPTYYFQIVVGIYVVQIIVIMTMLVNTITNGDDHLQQEYLLGQNVTKATILYCFITLVVMMIFNLLAVVVLGGIGSPGGI